MADDKLPAQPGYWAILPAGIRYDDRIPANAKLLYAEISSLTTQAGYCYADNAYFAALYQITERSVRRLLTALEEQGYIRIEEERGNHNALEARRIYAGINPLHGAEPLDKKVRPLDKKVQRHIIENNQEILTRVCSSRKHAPREAPDWKPERFEAFWRYYSRIPGEEGRRRNENKQSAMDAWDRLQPDDALIETIARALLRQRSTPEWKRGVGIPMAATYLNGARWRDAEELPAPGDPPQAAEPEERGVNIRWI